MDHTTELAEAATTGKLVAILGAGVSMAIAKPTTPAHTWKGLLQSAFQFANMAGRVDDNQYERVQETLRIGDLDELLGAADLVTKKLGTKKGLLYGRWLEEEFKNQKLSRSAALSHSLSALHKSRVPIATLNYDTLVEKLTKSSSITMNDPRSALAWSRRENSDILHLHGLWSLPETIVLGIGDYNSAISDEFRANLQRGLSSFSRLVFIGCGDTIQDPNFTSLLDWMRDVLGPAGLQHYALVRNDEVEAKLQNAHWQGLVRPIGFGDSYEQLPKFINDHLVSSLPQRVRQKKTVISDADVLKSYRQQVIVDCGKMTIEGVRADADTAKQKFDLERLFCSTVGHPDSARISSKRS